MCAQNAPAAFGFCSEIEVLSKFVLQGLHFIVKAYEEEDDKIWFCKTINLENEHSVQSTMGSSVKMTPPSQLRNTPPIRVCMLKEGLKVVKI